MYTTEVIAQALRSGAQNTLGSISKHWAYQMAVMAPKGLIQMGKTVGGPFTHARNFISAAAFAGANGILPFGQIDDVKKRGTLYNYLDQE